MSNDPWTVAYPQVSVRTDLGPLNLSDVLIARYHNGDNSVPLAALFNPEVPGVGEVWVDHNLNKQQVKQSMVRLP